MNGWKATIDEIRKQRIKTYHIINFALDNIRNDEEVRISGNYFYILYQDGNANIKFNEISSDLISLYKYRTFKTPFYRFFLSNTAQVGLSISIAIGVESDLFQVEDAQTPDMDISGLNKSFAYNQGTQIIRSALLTAVGYTALYQTPAGQTFLLDQACLSVYGTTSGVRTGGRINLRWASVDQGDPCRAYTFQSMPGVWCSTALSSPILIPAVADIMLECLDNAGLVYGFIKGRLF